VLGNDTVAQYKQVRDLCLVDLSLLPTVHNYLVWRHLNSLVLGEVTQQQMHFMSLEGDVGLQLQQLADQQSLSPTEAAGISDSVQVVTHTSEPTPGSVDLKLLMSVDMEAISDPVQPQIAVSTSPAPAGDPML